MLEEQSSGSLRRVRLLPEPAYLPAARCLAYGQVASGGVAESGALCSVQRPACSVQRSLMILDG